ncbi:MAG: sugar transferase, partial [Rhodoglobus sp.]|nr:sugar transferase [Rhodoglobus sp.]
ANLSEMLRNHDIDAALVTLSDRAVTHEVHDVMKACEGAGLQAQYFPAILGTAGERSGLSWTRNPPRHDVRPNANDTFVRIMERGIDVVGAALGIVALLPVLVVCAIAVKLSSRGPVIYRQTRIGQHGRVIACLKFRTMRVGAQAQQKLLRGLSEQDGPGLKIARDPRVTPVGRLLRKFSFDELPQLFNVLRGDLSLVGPRPPIQSEVDHYTWWQRRRTSVKPGPRCVWQVYGRNRVSFKRWEEMDLYYIDSRSIWLDLKLMVRTIRSVLGGTGM